MGLSDDPLRFSAGDSEDSFQTTQPTEKDPLTQGGSSRDQHHLAASADWNPTSVDTFASYGQLVDTPLAVDAEIFDQVDLQASTQQAKQTESKAEESYFTEIIIDDPVKRQEPSVIPGMSGGYVTYRVFTKTNLPSFNKKEVSVRRRFREFVALQDLLKLTHRGYIIPPRPEKNTVEGQRASEEFVETRRVNLQRYLNSLASHPVIGQSQELRVFLEAEGPLGGSMEWQHLQPLQGSFLDSATRLPKQIIGSDRVIPTPTESAQSARASGDFFRRFKELRQAVKNDHVEPPRFDAEECALRDETREITTLQDALSDASRKAENMVTRMEEQAVALGDFGLSLVKLCKFESEEGLALGRYTHQGAATSAIAADTRRTGAAAVRLGRLAKAANEQSISALDALHSHLALCPAVQKALREREAQLLTVQSLEADNAKKQKALSTLEDQAQRTFGNEISRSKKQDAVQNDIAAIDLALESAKSELHKIADRNRQELKRWHSERHIDFNNMQEAFARIQAAFHKRNAEVWSELANEFNHK